MGLNDTPKGERLHIALFGRRNAGKSSIINAITNQNLAIVSEIKGTTTDPVFKAMELLPIGPVMIIDTPGLDDNSELGVQRIEKTMEVLRKADIALLAADMGLGFSDFEYDMLKDIKERHIPCVIVLNKADLFSGEIDKVKGNLEKESGLPVCVISALEKTGINELKEFITVLMPKEEEQKLVGDLVVPEDLVVLVIPIDSAAPKGRLILPQQQTIRDILDSEGIVVVSKDNQLKNTLDSLAKKPKLVITDSQIFGKVSKIVPEDIMLTSFSILFARYKGDLKEQVRGAKGVESLKDGDRILIAEGCTHHRQCEDIGTVKIPNMLGKKTGLRLVFEFSSGGEFPNDLSGYALVIHCGGCTLNKKEMQYRIEKAKAQHIPIVNYGILIAHLQGILNRSMEPFNQLTD